jgi:hypothetical protein
MLLQDGGLPIDPLSGDTATLLSATHTSALPAPPLSHQKLHTHNH